ncbi:MAG: DUF3224 family protein [Acidimicrobiia bacterium]|nr:DUF3224 family protein [Acidimicrobiia bacterium]
MTTTTTTATGTAKFTSWAEDPAFDGDAPLPRLAHATVSFEYEGDLAGSSSCRYVLSYGADGHGTAVGFEELTGSLGGVPGTIVLRHEASFGESGVTTRWSVVAGAGTGGLADVRGEGDYEASHGSSGWAYRLDYHGAGSGK